MRLESGPAKADALWHVGRAILFLAFTSWFIYDGAIGWPARNQAEAEKWLAAPQPVNNQVRWTQLADKPAAETFEQLKRSAPKDRADVVKALGNPQYTAGNDGYYLSRYGRATVTYRGDRVEKISDWIPWYKSPEDIRTQFYWAILPAIPGLWFLWKLFKALTLHVTLDDEGLTYGGQRIAYADMVALKDYNRKGWIDLHYRAGDQEKRLRLDNEKIARFSEIVDAICEHKSFRNEVRIHGDERARRAADERAAAEAEARADKSSSDDPK